jgi:hypothetical protein
MLSRNRLSVPETGAGGLAGFSIRPIPATRACAAFAVALSISITHVNARAQGTPAQPDSAHQDSIARARSRAPATLGTVTVTATPADRREPSVATHITAATIALTPAATPWELLRQTAGMEVHQAGQPACWRCSQRTPHLPQAPA